MGRYFTGTGWIDSLRYGYTCILSEILLHFSHCEISLLTHCPISAVGSACPSDVSIVQKVSSVIYHQNACTLLTL